jgi:hypothetical protein
VRSEPSGRGRVQDRKGAGDESISLNTAQNIDQDSKVDRGLNMHRNDVGTLVSCDAQFTEAALTVWTVIFGPCLFKETTPAFILLGILLLLSNNTPMYSAVAHIICTAAPPLRVRYGQCATAYGGSCS